ncbi:nucleoside diphosphate kinase regulator [Sphingomonas sp.]|uniref:nucleoside diphosphate kinase regulator n=1 Tax=Sphingomonas sp. TaxID=28214 RepID=UPI002BA65D58|nr:nucleoside diphosphate kinase regulator [Sphingomonas sp.]HWK34654.1 nucleoside diphosphate kinase regulator [Sphingomonas sp.]
MLHLIDSEAETLAGLAVRIESRQPDLARLLFEEIDRAELHTADDLPAHTVAMNSHVAYVDESSGTRRTVQVVYPQDADIDAGRISVLTPIGAGLIGLSEGASIVWPDRDGHDRVLRIESVRPGSGG